MSNIVFPCADRASGLLSKLAAGELTSQSLNKHGQSASFQRSRHKLMSLINRCRRFIIALALVIAYECFGLPLRIIDQSLQKVHYRPRTALSN